MQLQRQFFGKVSRIGFKPQAVTQLVSQLQCINALAGLRRPLLAALEVRAAGEVGVLLMALPLLSRAPRGDGHPVLLMPGFGGGLTFCSLLVRWGARVTPLGVSDRELPPLTGTALDIVNGYRAEQDPHGRSAQGLMAPVFVEQRIS